MTSEEIAELLKAAVQARPQVTQTFNFNAPVGQQIAHVDRIEAHFDKDMGMQIANAGEINNGAPQPKPSKVHVDDDKDVLSPINTPEAQQLWQKAQDAGWVDADRQPTNRLHTKASKAVFANVMIERLNIPQPGYEPFEELWGVKGLQNSYSSGMGYNVNMDKKEEIKDSLR